MIKFICRIIALPFVFGLILVTYNVHVVKYSILFLLYGGEWITYKKGERKTIQDIFKKLNENI